MLDLFPYTGLHTHTHNSVRCVRTTWRRMHFKSLGKGLKEKRFSLLLMTSGLGYTLKSPAPVSGVSGGERERVTYSVWGHVEVTEGSREGGAGYTASDTDTRSSFPTLFRLYLCLLFVKKIPPAVCDKCRVFPSAAMSISHRITRAFPKSEFRAEADLF